MTSIAVTGATGYLGRLIAEHLTARGDTLTALTRRAPEGNHLGWQKFELGQPLDPSAFDGIEALIHAAWVLAGKDTDDLWRQNVAGTRMLLESASAAGVSRIVFVSSMSAFFGTRQAYGLMKLAAERTVLDAGGVVVRPGLVYGDSPGGMAGTLKKVAALPLWPRFRNANLFLVHEDDIAPGIGRVLDGYGDLRGQVLGFAHPARHSLIDILTGLSPRRTSRRTVYVPAGAVIAPLKLAESANVPLPFRSDSLLGLVEGASTLPGQEALNTHHITFREFDALAV